MKKISIFLMIAIFSSNALFGSDKIPWISNMDVGTSIAKKYKLPMLVFVYSKTCKYCIQSIKNFKNPDLKSVLSSGEIVPIYLQKDSPQLSNYSLSARTYPTYFLLSSNGEMVAAPLNGYVKPGELAAYLRKFIKWSKKVQQ